MDIGKVLEVTVREIMIQSGVTLEIANIVAFQFDLKGFLLINLYNVKPAFFVKLGLPLQTEHDKIIADKVCKLCQQLFTWLEPTPESHCLCC
jgi:hypothetical protein